MDRVDALGSPLPHREPERRRKIEKKRRLPEASAGAAGVEAHPGEFAHLLQSPQTEADLAELLDEVNESGERLHEEQTLENIRLFREAVRRFLTYVVNNALQVIERVSGANVLRRKKFTLVEVIDRKLESLAAVVLAGQAEQMEILRRVDEIRGLIVDLVT